MSVSSDFVFYGKIQDMDAVWKEIINCSEADKLLILLRLLAYFTEVKKRTFPLSEEQTKDEQKLLHFMQKLQDDGKFL